MAPDFPSDLIRDIQIRMRQVAGVPSYDPGDLALPSVPSVGEAVTALDPSLPDYLRCKRCRGGLHRGINSTLCIYCGAEQGKEGISRSIRFNSTAGYLKLLQSLDLDGSEMVNLEVESKESSKGQDSQKGGVTLSNFLDLELRWPRQIQEINNTTTSKAPSQSAALTNISCLNLDDFFSHDGNLLSVDFLPREINLSSRSENSGFFEEQQSLQIRDPDDAFTDWESDFQSASSVTLEPNFKQIDLFHNSTDFQSANLTAITTEHRTIDLFQNSSNFQSDNPEAHSMESTVSIHIHDFQNSGTEFYSYPIITPESDQSTNIAHNLSDAGACRDWFQDVDQLENIGSAYVPEVKNEEKETTSVGISWARDDRSDLFDDWQDFTTGLQPQTCDKVHVFPSDPEDLEFGSFTPSGDSVARRTNQSKENVKVDMLLAQMPDLSFMLEESLCIPKKANSSELNT